MTSITKQLIRPIKTVKIPREKKSILTRYREYTARNNQERVLWYMKVILAIPCVFMVLSIIAMSMVTPNYVWFVGLNILLFFANVIAHVGQAKSTFYIPLYHATISLMILIPLIAYLLS